VEAWELDAREQIRGLVAAYNALGDRGRLDGVMALFADDAVMDVGDGRTYEGVDQIRTIFTGTRDSILDGGDGDGDASSSTTRPAYTSPWPAATRPPATPTSR